MANKRITEVDFIDSLNSNESFFINQNSTLKQINKKNVVMEVVNGGTGGTTLEEAQENLGITAIDNKVIAVDERVTTVDERVTATDNKWAGCQILFVDEDGNPTDEPYIHWYVEE